MPGKVNPVIPEAVTQAALLSIGHDQTITIAVAMGSLELNPFLPLVAHCLLESSTCWRPRAIRCGATAWTASRPTRRGAGSSVENATATATALVPLLGYERAGELVVAARREGRALKDVAIDFGWVTEEQFAEATSPEAVCRLGFAGAGGRQDEE